MVHFIAKKKQFWYHLDLYTRLRPLMSEPLKDLKEMQFSLVHPDRCFFDLWEIFTACHHQRFGGLVSLITTFDFT